MNDVPTSSRADLPETAQGGAAIVLSVVVPVKNEADNIAPLIAEIRAALTGGPAYEILYVDDGSTDATPARLREAAASAPELRVLTHAASCGQSAALRTGIMGARGRLIATLDGDGQNDPADLPRLVAAFLNPASTVELGMIAGQRVKRRDSMVKRWSSRIANRVRSGILGDDTPDTGCGLKVFAREAFLRLPYFDHVHRFLPALMRREGYIVGLEPVNHRPRVHGRSKYGINNRLWVGIVDLFGVCWLQRRMRRPTLAIDFESDFMTERAKIDVLGVGNAIVDVLAETGDAFLAAEGIAKGGMTLINADRADSLYSRMPAGIEMSGGSAANTLAGIASLGGSGAYIGKVRDDQLGSVFAHDIRAIGVHFETPPATDGLPTARCLILITPDAQRSMNTFLGASTLLKSEDIDPALVQSAQVTYLEGYLFDRPEAKAAFFQAAKMAHEAGRKVALTLSDTFCVERHHAEFSRLIDHVDILFANEGEARALTGADGFVEAAKALALRCPIACVTHGAQGSIIFVEDRAFEIAAASVDRVVDTTGAGDLYAAGVLYGLTNGRDPATAGRIGSIAAAEAIGHVGPRPQRSLRELVAKALD